VARATARLTQINTVQPGRDRLTEYDLIDLNCLIEWAHGRMVELVKRVAAEHKIDAEIDFAIQRVDRGGLIRGDTAAEPRRQERGRGLGSLRRVG
jgi:hypothetical protein